MSCEVLHKNIIIWEGDDCDELFQVVDQNKDPIDITGNSFKLTAVLKYGDDTPFLESDGIITSATDGKFKIPFIKSQTDGKVGEVKILTNFTMSRTKPDGKDRVVSYGQITINPKA